MSALDRFRRLVQTSGVSVAELARRTGRSRQSLQQSLTETVPRLDTVAAVLHALGQPWSVLDADQVGAGAGPGAYVIEIRISDRLRPCYAGRSWRERPVELSKARRFASRCDAQAFLDRRTPSALDPTFAIIPVVG